LCCCANPDGDINAKFITAMKRHLAILKIDVSMTI
jgi:hypothetical protein